MTNSLDERYQVRSVSRAVAILELLAASGNGKTVTEIAREVGGSKSSIFSTLQTLSAHGLVASGGGEGAAHHYRLGLALARLGEAAVDQVSLRNVALPVLSELGVATGLSARLATPDNGFAVVVGRVDSPSAVRFNLHMGQRECPHSSGLGKAIMAELDDDEAERILRHNGMPEHTENTITELPVLLNELAAVRKRGYAIDEEEDAPGVFCVAAAIRDHGGRCAGAVSVTGLKLDLPVSRIHEIGDIVRAHADRISDRLAGRG